jgi:UDP-GlcNAc3NAcA epimerase
MNILYVVGNRPQFIKLAILHDEMKKYGLVNETVIHTGQHFSTDMSEVFFGELLIDIPIVNLGIRKLSDGAMIGRTLESLETQTVSKKPDVIVVFGDTNSTLAGAIAGKKLNIPVAHIEAGIRTYQEDMPEESNRYLTDRLSLFNFCCTPLGLKNLAAEGYGVAGPIVSRPILSGDVMLDAFNKYHNRFAETCARSDLDGSDGNYVLATIHRRKNIEDPATLMNIITALNEVNENHQVICPLHPNTKNKIQNCAVNARFTISPPVGYFEMQRLLHHCSYVITDSGGVQREAFFASKPVLIVMDKPFWPEILENGNALNCSPFHTEIVSAFNKLKKQARENDVSIFGNGTAAQLIVKELIGYFQNV